jgi:hypothetical protein
VNFINLKFYNYAELLNIRFSYLCRTTRQNEDGKSPIVLRITFRSQRRDVFSGLYCFKDDWDSENTKVKKADREADSLNKNLQVIHQKAAHCFDELKFSGNAFTIDELIDKIRGREERPTLLIEFLEDGSLKMKKRVGTEILNVTYMKYKRSVAYMKDFLQAEYKVKNFSLQKVTMEFLEQHFQYLRTEKRIAHNTACKYLVCVKTIFSPAIRNGIIKPDPFYRLRLNPKPVYKDILTQDEIDKIVALELKDSLTQIASLDY